LLLNGKQSYLTLIMLKFNRVAMLIAVGGIAALIAPSRDAFANEFKVGAITIETPGSRATPGGAKVAAGYFTVKNDAASL
jgi:periplasmic copper chaperone A